MAIVVVALLGIVPLGALAEEQTGSSGVTVTVQILPAPLRASLSPDCAFEVTGASPYVDCALTLLVDDPSLTNAGWRASLAAAGLVSARGETLPPSTVTISEAAEPIILAGQRLDRLGGPDVPAGTVGSDLGESRSIFVAEPGYGNGAYELALTVRLTVPADTTPGIYRPIWRMDIGTVQGP